MKNKRCEKNDQIEKFGKIVKLVEKNREIRRKEFKNSVILEKIAKNFGKSWYTPKNE